MALLVNAIPAYNEWQVFRQKDETTLRLLLVGDEWLHYYITDDHVPVVEKEGAFFYARVCDNKVFPTQILAHEKLQRTAQERSFMTTVGEVERLRPLARRKMSRRIGERNHPTYIGEKKGLIILVDFPDCTFHDNDGESSTDTRQRYDNVANKPGYTNDMGAVGSVHDYFSDQSYGLFNLSFDIVGPVTMSQSFSYYGQDLGDDSADLNVPEMLVEACTKVDAMVDFSQYDWDGDGTVEQVFLLYAGYGQATGGSWDTIWPHMWSLTEAKEEEGLLDGPVAFDGVAVDVYACSNELYGRQGTVEMGIGTICHEFSHCLGLPDLYDVNKSSNFTLGTWDVLARGNYNGPGAGGWVPAGYSSYERWFAGWLEPTVLNNDTVVGDMPPLDGQPVAYVIYNDAHPNEYFLLENRTQSRWDSYLPGQGLLISHVDYDEQMWMDNMVNTLSETNDHLRLSLVHASNKTTGGNDAYPYEDNDSLTDLSQPAATLFHANTDGTFLMHKPVYSIAYDEIASLVAFRFENRNNNLTSIPMLSSDQKSITKIYRLDGTEVTCSTSLSSPLYSPSIYIVLYSDGSVEKVLHK